MNYKPHFIFKGIKSRIFALCIFSSIPMSSHSGYLLYNISDVYNRNYIVTAQLSIYDANNTLIDQQRERAEGIFSSWNNTGSSILFGGSLVFPTPFPLSPGDNGGVNITLHNFEVDRNSLLYQADRISAQIDWFDGTSSFTQDWSMAHGDDFVNGIAYYSYYKSYFPEPAGELLANGYYADLQMIFASGITPIPAPGAIWLLGSGLLGLLGIGYKSRNSPFRA